MNSVKNIRSNPVRLFYSQKSLHNASSKLLVKNLISRHNTPNVRNIHTASFKKRSGIYKLKHSLIRKTKDLLAKNYFDCQEFINVQAFIAKSLPETANITPSYGFNEDVSRAEARKASHSELSDESGSIYYLNGPKILDGNADYEPLEKAIPYDKSEKCGEDMKIRKVLIKKPKIVICSKGSVKNFHPHRPNEIKITVKPFKDLNELLVSSCKAKPKGKVRRGLCINTSSTPASRGLHNIKITN